jgi:hypothetical protein
MSSKRDLYPVGLLFVDNEEKVQSQSLRKRGFPKGQLILFDGADRY